MSRFQQGYTLVELMVSMTLGLLIVAATLSIYLSGQRFLSLQHGMSELQQNGLFGLMIFTHELRHANLNTDSEQVIDNKILGSGIVFSSENLPSSLSTIDSTFLTKQDVQSFGTIESSDQLMIQFVPPYVAETSVQVNQDVGGTETYTTKTSSKMVDCEGQQIEYSQSEVGDIPATLTRVYVQRYYLAEIKQNGASYSPQKFALYCDAGYYSTGDSSITGLGQNSQQVMQNIDIFKVRLGVKSPDGNFQYMSINNYLKQNESFTSTDQYYQVVSLEVGLLTKSTSSIGINVDIDNDKVFSLFADASTDDDVRLKNDQKTETKYLRQVFSQVVALRNTLGGTS